MRTDIRDQSETPSAPMTSEDPGREVLEEPDDEFLTSEDDDDPETYIDESQPQAERVDNLQYELSQLDGDVAALLAEGARLRSIGQRALADADGRWKTLRAEDQQLRRRPNEPHILSVELINAGPGESILLHYGRPDDLRVVMINSGTRAAYKAFVEPRLRELRDLRGRPVVIDPFVAGDQDFDKVEGLLRMLDHVRETPSADERLVEIRRIWANLFRGQGGRGLRQNLVSRIVELQIPLNAPFDHLVMRPEQGRAVVKLAGDLEIVVLGPERQRVQRLYARWSDLAREQNATIEDFPNETFSRVEIARTSAPLSLPPGSGDAGDCQPSENARTTARGDYLDASVPNLASTILLFRYRDKTFLHTGDTRGDLLLESLERAGLLDRNGSVHVDLMSIPHGGSDRNVTMGFFEKVQADRYLFSGDGRYGRPEVTAVASLIAARGCARYEMFFTNRDSSEKGYAPLLDAFFAQELPYQPNYRRVFRPTARGSVMVDLLDPMPF